MNIYSVLAEEENEVVEVTQQIKNVPKKVEKKVEKNIIQPKTPIVKNNSKLSPNLDKFELEPSHKSTQKSSQKSTKNDRQKSVTKTSNKAKSTGWDDKRAQDDVEEPQEQDQELKPEEEEQIVQISLDDYLKENSNQKILLPARKPTSDKKWEKLQQVQKDDELDSLFKPMVRPKH